jgi:hypothetical protein
MEQHYLAALQDLLAEKGGANLAPPHLERFYNHCTRQPAAWGRGQTPLPLKTLLYHHRHLRPAVREALAAFVARHWEHFATNHAPADEDAPAASPETPATPSALPVESRPFPDDDPMMPSPKSGDWFDRFLDLVRIILFR